MQRSVSSERPLTPEAVDATLAESNYGRLQANFQAFIEMLPIGIIHEDLHYRITRVNRSCCEMLGRAADELVGYSLLDLCHPEDLEVSTAAIARLFHGEIQQYAIDKRYLKKDGSTVWAHVRVAPSYDAHGHLDGAIAILKDITARKEAEAEVERINKELVAASRQAGMAEIATNVLHNVGNVLNSVNVSADLVINRIKSLRGESLQRIVELLQKHSEDLSTFLSGERGKYIPEFLNQAAQHLTTNQRAALEELQSLVSHIDHIKDIVSTQQAYAKRCGITETVQLATLVEDGLVMNRGGLARHGVTLVKQFEPVPTIVVDKHKVLQILVNLIRNAKQACDASHRVDKTISVRIAPSGEGVLLEVTDNGVGIAPEHRPKLFTHGFTTKKGGHGFGLHSGALAARELGGTLEAQSAGIGLGSTFTLTLPLKPPGETHVAG